MYAIETELGRFEADTEKEAKAALRKAQAKQAKIDAQEAIIRKQCYTLAEAQAYRIYERKHNSSKMPAGWRLLPVADSGQLAAVRKGYDTKRGERFYEIETEQGTARVYPYDAITHYVENGAGFCVAVLIQNQDCELFAVGVNQERCAWVPVWGVKASEFNRPRE